MIQRMMTPVQSYRFGPATKLVVHSSRGETNASCHSRNGNLKKEIALVDELSAR